MTIRDAKTIFKEQYPEHTVKGYFDGFEHIVLFTRKKYTRNHKDLEYYLIDDYRNIKEISLPVKDIVDAHKFSMYNVLALQKDKKCGCFYCCKIFDTNEIKELLNEGPGTALCPYCGNDTLIGESAGYPLTKEFLNMMYEFWINNCNNIN